jgi:ABC-type hemin transport system substrate-binding protein
VRIVSLVPSLTETVAELGRGRDLVGVTTYCDVGAPASAARVGGTKNPDVAAVVALAPDVVLANAEENRPADLDALRAAGLTVSVTYPRRVADVPPLLRDVGALLSSEHVAEALAVQVERAHEAARGRDRPSLRTLVLVWRKPWMAAGADTYAADLLRICGFAVTLDRGPERYPRLRAGDDALVDLDVVLLPSEPYAFGPDDLPAVRALVGEVPTTFVDGRLLTWHGSRTAAALETFTALATGFRP